MATEDIKRSIEHARRYLAEHPAEARYTDSAATARLEQGLRCRVEGPEGATVTTDMPRSVGGGGEAPSPGWLFRAAQAACDATVIAMRAAEEGIALNRLEVTVDSESDDRGILGMDGAVPAGPLRARVRIKIGATVVAPERLRKVVEWAEAHSPVGDAVCRAIPRAVEVEVA